MKPNWFLKLEEIAKDKGLEVSHGPCEGFAEFTEGPNSHGYINDFDAGWSITYNNETPFEIRLKLLESMIELERWKKQELEKV